MNREEIAKSIDEGLQILKQEPSFIFNLEEIEAIQYLQNEIIDIQKDIDFHLDKENIISKEELKAKQTILNLISKLQKELDKKDKCLKACEDNLIKERQLRIKQDKVINCLIDLLQQEGYLKFDNREQAIDYIDKLIKAEEENE